MNLKKSGNSKRFFWVFEDRSFSNKHKVKGTFARTITYNDRLQFSKILQIFYICSIESMVKNVVDLTALEKMLSKGISL